MKNYPKYHYDLDQGSDQWYEIRKLKMTASHAQAIATAGKGLDTYIKNKVLELIVPKQNFDNEHTIRGKELEPIAISEYELNNNLTVKKIGFIEHSNRVGCSPDGLVNNDGIIEVKCRKDDIYYDTLITRKIPSSDMWQIQMNLLISKIKWCDYICYNPNFTKSMLQLRVFPNPNMHDKLLKGLDKGEELFRYYLNNPVTKYELNS